MRVSELAEGNSFAYLKELCLASTMRWLATPQAGAMDAVMLEQVGILRDQMASVPMPGDEPPSPDQPLPPGFYGPGVPGFGRLLGRQVHRFPGP